MFGDSMSVPEAKARIKKLERKGTSRTSREDTELMLLEAFVTGRPVTTTRDHNPPKKKGFFSW